MRKITKIEPSVLHIARRKRVAAYARVSSGKDAMLQSLSAQVSYYSGYIQNRRDWEYAGVYAEACDIIDPTQETVYLQGFQRVGSNFLYHKIGLIPRPVKNSTSKSTKSFATHNLESTMSIIYHQDLNGKVMMAYQSLVMDVLHCWA